MSDDLKYVVFNKKTLEFHSEHSSMKSAKTLISEFAKIGRHEYVWTTKRNHRINIAPRRAYFEEKHVLTRSH